ncbi:hypothetical protein [Mesorhizobium sp.]|uniref:hypothetical protein n=1 Tax=Mesorhizobium sp. TaxID=1871066 RepID=UPI000FE59000|nr:hypothetical protein [Mesorhizobium sp.]RWE37450.1 MAG: hypothetical protein EOS77_02400 [Mesorhizobium sp.]
MKSTDAQDEHRRADCEDKYGNRENFRGLDDTTREAVMRHECADRVSMASLGLGERPSDLNQWIDDEAAELATRLATLEKPIHVGAVQSMIAELARGAALYVISDKATLITNLANAVHRANVERGWWNDPKTGEDLHGKRNFGELMALCHSELTEALEARRKGDEPDDKLPHRPGWRVELIDEIIRCLDILGSEGNDEHPAGVIFVEKDHFNSVREDHRPENRVKEGGKTF